MHTHMHAHAHTHQHTLTHTHTLTRTHTHTHTHTSERHADKKTAFYVQLLDELTIMLTLRTHKHTHKHTYTHTHTHTHADESVAFFSTYHMNWQFFFWCQPRTKALRADEKPPDWRSVDIKLNKFRVQNIQRKRNAMSKEVFWWWYTYIMHEL